MNVYGFGEFILNGIAYIYTKIFWSTARLIRLPIYARNKKAIRYKEGLTTGYACRLNVGTEGKLCLGKNCTLGDYVQIEAMQSVIIGDNVLCGSKVYIGDSSHGNYSERNQTGPHISPNQREIISKPIAIGNNVWIGNGVSILSGVVIGDGAVIAAGAVVTKNIAENTIVAGCPAQVIKKYNHETHSWEKLL